MLLISLVAALFAGAAPASADTMPPIITHVRIENAPVGKPIVVRARIEDESEVFAPSIYVRPVGAANYDNIPMEKVEDAYQATIPAEQVTRALEYFIEAFDEQGNGPVREGTPEDPIRILVFDPDEGPPPPPPGAEPPPPGVPPPPPPPSGGGIATKWWFWTLIGVVVVGGTVGAVLGTQGGGTDSVDVMVVGADPATRLSK